MENTGSKCDVCLGGEGQASASSQLLPLITKHLGNFMRMKPVRACEGCGQLLTLWDDFSRQARLNLAISRPEAVINSEQCEKYKQLLQADNSTQDLNFPCDSTFVSPTSNKGDIPDSQCPIDSKTEIFTNPEDGSILKSILQLPEKTTGLEENTVAYLRQIKLAPIDIQHFASKKCFEESKPSEASNEDLSHSETTETFACTEESSFTSDFMCKQTQTSTTMKSMEKGKTVLPPAIPLPQFTSIIRMSSVEAKSTAVVSVSKREENNENMLTTPGNFASTENQVAVQQNQIISTVTKRSYANTTKIEYVNLGCLPCPTCSATLPTQKALHEHMMNSCLQNRHSQFICAFCAKQYNSKLGLNYHLMQHFTELSSIPCPVCKAVMASKRTLRSHQLRFHPEELPAPALTPCVFCKVMFFKSVLLKHYNNCRQNNLVVCLKKCNMAEQLSVFACSCCYKIFTNKSDLLHHMESVHKVTYHSSSEAKFTCTLCSHKLEEVQDSIQITEKISVNEGSINSQIISASDTISDSQVSSPSEGMVVNEQKISSSEEIVGSQMLSHVEGISVTCQSPSSTEEIVDVILSPAEVSYVNDQILSSTDNQMQSSNEKIIDNQITSSTVIEDAESVQCQICKRKFTVLHNYVSRVEEVLTSKPTSDSNTFNEFALENNETSRKKIVPSLRQRQHVKTVPKKKLFKCKDCGKIFPYASWLQRHQTTAKHAKEVSPEQVGPDEPNSASEEDNKIANRVEIQQKQSTVATDPQGNETSLSICKLCNRGFDKFSGLLRHLSYHDEKEAKVLKDSLLLERSKSNEAKQIKDKVLVRPITNELTCHMCFKTMENVKQLKYHIHAAHLAKNSRLKCRLCPFRFITPESLNRHMVVHSNSSNNESNLNLATQMDTASGNKMQHSYTKSKYTCKICFKSFNDSYGFQRHKSYNHNFKRQHSSRRIQPTTVIKTFKCKLCQNKYPTVRGLNQHLRRFHNSAELLEKTEEEKVKEFIASNSKTASVAESFKCTLCQNKYPTVRGLNQHLRRFHNSTELLEQPEEEMIVEKAKKCVASSVNNLPCDYCHLVFPSESALETHFQMDHMQSGIENVVSGPIALFESPSKENKIETSVELNAEPEQIGAKQAKKFGCKICNRLFFSKGRLHIHLFNAHQKRTKVFSIAYQCKYCMKQLSNAERLKKHMQVLHASNPHSFQKSNFNCDLCGRGVNTKMGLFRHMLHHRKWV